MNLKKVLEKKDNSVYEKKYWKSRYYKLKKIEGLNKFYFKRIGIDKQKTLI
ncbi:hypothetical protein KAI52_00590 [Candidatus Parcubacteria bacterium]|nr:hypothetical protein [Candidatus Parcubacteria bacterium]